MRGTPSMNADTISQEANAQVSATKIRELNDALRTSGRGGRVVMTAGIAALAPDEIATIVRAVATFDAFTSDNDFYGEHDCASLTVEGRQVIWKIDSYDRALICHSPDPTDPAVTTRVLTIMLAEE